MNLIWRHPSGGRLWQGDHADTLRWTGLLQTKVKLVILAAIEHQPKLPSCFDVIRVRLDDNPEMEADEATMTERASRKAADLAWKCLSAGMDVLSSCYAGRNRSGIVSAMILIKFCDMSANQAIAKVRRARLNALTNPEFVRILKRVYMMRQNRVARRV